MLNLPDVTLVAISSVQIDETMLALSISSQGINFGEIKFLTSEDAFPADPKIRIESIPRLDFVGYSRFMLQDLHCYIDTPYCLVIQADGFVLNPERWQNCFLDYDYIGAPWTREITSFPTGTVLNMAANQVGNGGFSLRSKRLLLETAKIDFDSLSFVCLHEDIIICHYFLDQMLEAGIRFPKPMLAAQFAVESPEASYGQNPQTSFGFHGKSLRDAILGSIQLD